MSESILRIVTDPDSDGPVTASSVRVLLGDSVIPLIRKIELGANGDGLMSGDFVEVRITVAVKLG